MLEHPVIAYNPTLLAQHCIINWIITAKSHLKYHAQHLMSKVFPVKMFMPSGENNYSIISEDRHNNF